MSSAIEELFVKFADSPAALVWALVWALFIISVFIIACLMLWKVCCTTFYLGESIREIEMNNRNEHSNRGTDRPNIGQEVEAVTQV